MVAGFDDPALIEHDDPVEVLQGRQAVGDGDDGAAVEYGGE